MGALVAARLGWRFVDLDAEIERAAGRTVAQIFADDGESGFRLLEREATIALRGQDGLVLAPGGGWAAVYANREALGEGATLVYLQATPATAARRLAAAPGVRPLVAGPDPEAELEKILAARAPSYLQANHTVTVDSMSADDVASIIVALVLGDVQD